MCLKFLWIFRSFHSLKMTKCAVIVSEQSERGNPKSKKTLNLWIATLNSLCLLCCAIEFYHAVPFRCQTHHTTPCCALLNLAPFATPHRTPNFRPTRKAQAPPRSKALRKMTQSICIICLQNLPFLNLKN